MFYLFMFVKARLTYSRVLNNFEKNIMVYQLCICVTSMVLQNVDQKRRGIQEVCYIPLMVTYSQPWLLKQVVHYIPTLLMSLDMGSHDNNK